MADLRARLAAVIGAHWYNDWGINDADMCACGQCPPNEPDDDGQGSRWAEHVADTVIRDIPELGRIAKVTEVCIASLDLDSRVGTALSDRQWLAETILNVLNGAVDE